MFFTASIKPTSAIHLHWSSRQQICGFIQGVCFSRQTTTAGPRYIADRLSAADIASLMGYAAVQIAATAVRVPEEPVKIPSPPKRVKAS